MFDKKQFYDSPIWTKHALQRLVERKLSQEIANQTFYHPDRKIPGKKKGTLYFQKFFATSVVTIVAKQNEQREWIIISSWIDPPFHGTKDAKKKQIYRDYQKASFWGKLWLLVKRQIGISAF